MLRDGAGGELFERGQSLGGQAGLAQGGDARRGQLGAPGQRVAALQRGPLLLKPRGVALETLPWLWGKFWLTLQNYCQTSGDFA